MSAALTWITYCGFVVVVLVWIFAAYTDSPILETILRGLWIYTTLVLIMLLDRAFQYFNAKREKRLHEKEQ